MKSSPLTWLCRALWLSVPLLLGDVFTKRLADVSRTTSVVWQVFLWVAWLLVGVALLVQLPRTLTVLRMGVPVAPLLGVLFWSTSGSSGYPGVLGVLGVIVSFVVAALVMSADVGADFVDGASYGDERRLGLNPPVFLLVGPIQALWLLAVVPTVSSVTLFATARWLAAAIGLIVASAGWWYSFRLLNRLSERCLVLVPAGLTLVDPLALAEPTLFRRDDIVRLGPAVVGSDDASGVLDLTAGAPGLVVSMDFSRQLTVIPAVSRGQVAASVEITSALVAPSRPGRLLDLAQQRKVAVGRD